MNIVNLLIKYKILFNDCDRNPDVIMILPVAQIITVIPNQILPKFMI